MKKRKIEDARADKTGVITHVRLNGNKRFTSVKRVIPMAERNEIQDVHVVYPRNARTHLRTGPDGSAKNNLDILAGT